MNFNKNIAIGEMIGSLILTLTVILGALAVKKNEKTLNTPFKKRLVNALVIGAGVTSGVVTAIYLGSGGKINPAFSVMIAFFTEWDNIATEIGFELMGATAAALIGLLVSKLWKDSPSLSETFSFNKQPIGKVVGIEALANVFWVVPIGAMVWGVVKNPHVGNSLTLGTSGFQIALFATITLMVIIVAVEQIGAPNLNPQIWFGMLIVKLVAQRGKIAPREILAESMSAITVIGIGAAFGAILNTL